MKTIYRVQDKDGRGPWKPGFSHKWVVDREDQDNLPPWPFEFGGVNRVLRRATHSRMNIGCGCLSTEQLRRWFIQDEYRTLSVLGYRCVKLDVDGILAQSDIQCVFERSKALHLEVEPVDLYP